MRRYDKGRAKMRYPMSFKKMCNLVGIDPVKRVKLMKILHETQNKKGSELIN